MRIIVSRPLSVIGGNYLLFCDCGSMAAVRWTENMVSAEQRLQMYVVNGSDGRCLVAVRLIVGVRYLERPLREVLLYTVTRNATALGSLMRQRAVTRCNLAVSDMYMRDFGKTHQIAYTYCSVGISDLKPLTGTSADQLPYRKSRSLATA